MCVQINKLAESEMSYYCQHNYKIKYYMRSSNCGIPHFEIYHISRRDSEIFLHY